MKNTSIILMLMLTLNLTAGKLADLCQEREALKGLTSTDITCEHLKQFPKFQYLADIYNEDAKIIQNSDPYDVNVLVHLFTKGGAPQLAGGIREAIMSPVVQQRIKEIECQLVRTDIQ